MVCFSTTPLLPSHPPSSIEVPTSMPCRQPGPHPRQSHQHIPKLHLSRIRKTDFRSKLLFPLLSLDGLLVTCLFPSITISGKLISCLKLFCAGARYYLSRPVGIRKGHTPGSLGDKHPSFHLCGQDLFQAPSPSPWARPWGRQGQGR